MNKDELMAKIREILDANKGEDDWSSSPAENCNVEIAVETSGTIEVKIRAEYYAPPFNSGVIFAFCDLFGTMKIDEDQFSYGGCETCNYGSSYGYTLTIKESTLVIQE